MTFLLGFGHFSGANCLNFEGGNSWVFPKIMVSPNHPLKNRVFQYFHHPFWGTIIFGKHLNLYFMNFCFSERLKNKANLAG